MTKSIIVSMLILSSTMNTSVAAKTDCNNLKGTWVNQFGATLNIDSVSQNGEVAGIYLYKGIEHPLNGWASTRESGSVNNTHSSTVISFSAHYETYGNLESWSGTCQVVEDVPTIKALWHLMKAETSASYDHIISGSDSFTPMTNS